ncbi:MAG: translocation/assembly module TamB domain-containing protein [Chitinophagales bacterium]
MKKRILKILFWFVAVLLLLSGLVLILVRLPAVQTYLAQRATAIISNKLGTKVSIEKVRISFFREADFVNFYLEDLNHDTLIYAHELQVTIDAFDLLEKKLTVRSIGLDNGDVFIHRDSTGKHTNITEVFGKLKGDTVKPQKPTPFAWTIDLRFVTASGTRFRYWDEKGHLDLHVDVPSLDIELKKFDLQKQMIAVKTAALDHADVRIDIAKHESTPNTDTDHVVHFMPGKLNVTYEELALTDAHFILNNHQTDTLLPKGMDFKHLDITGINLNVDSGIVSRDSILGHIKNMQAQDRCGLTVKQLVANARVSIHDITLSNLHLTTPQSEVKNYVSLRYEYFNDFRDFVHAVTLKADLKGTKLAIKDLNYFVRKWDILEHNQFNITGQIDGPISRLSGKRIEISTGASTQFKGDFHSSGLPNAFETSLNLRVERLSTSMTDLRRIYPKLKIPENLNSLGVLSYQGSFDGFLTDFVSTGKLVTAIGYATTDLNFKYDKEKNKSAYSGKLALFDFDLGKFFRDEKNLGKVTLNTEIKGGGLTLESLRADLNGNVNSIVLKNYNYKDIKIDGLVKGKSFSGNLKIKDEHLQADFAGGIDLTRDVPEFRFSSRIYKAELDKLNISKANITVKGRLTSDFSGDKVDNFIGSIGLEDVQLTRDDTISASFKNLHLDARLLSAETKKLRLMSDFAEGELEGDFTFRDLPVALYAFAQSTFTRDYQDTLTYEDQNFNIDLRIGDPDNLTRIFAPQFYYVRNSHIRAFFNSQNHHIDGNATIGDFKFSNVQVKGTDVVASAANGSFDFRTYVDKVYTGDSLMLDTVKVLAQTEANRDIRFDVFAADKKRKNYLDLTSYLTPLKGQAVIRLDTSDIKLANYHWHFNKDNSIFVEGKKIVARNLIFRSEEQTIYISSYLKNDTSTSIKLTLDNTSISDFTGIFTSKIKDLQGNVNGALEVQDIFYKPSVFADFVVDEFKLGNELIGDVNIESKLDDARSKVLIYASVKSANPNIDFRNDIEAKGELVLGSTPQLDVSIKAKKLGLNFLNFSFFNKFVKNVTGYATANARLKGPLNKLLLTGDVDLIDDNVTVTFLNSPFRLTNQHVKLDEHGIDFGSNLMAYDSKKNLLTASGRINHESFKRWELDCTAYTDNALFLNTTAKESPFFYGVAYGAGLVKFSGSINSPRIEATATTRPGTYCHLPITSTFETNRYGFYRFVNPKDSTVKNAVIPLKLNGVNFILNLTVTPDARMDIILDPLTGDILTGYGNGYLKIELPKTGNMSIRGKYTIERGDYKFTLQTVVKKPFEFEPGGTVEFDGDVYKAKLNLTAAYKVRASPLELIDVSAAGNSQLASLASGSVPVKLLMNLTGVLEKPTIGFDIQFSDLDPTLRSYVEQRLALLRLNDAEMNKQVLGLLVMNRFLPEGTSTGNALANTNYLGGTAATTVSEFLTSQISNYLSELLQLGGVKDLNVFLGYKQYDQASNNNTTSTGTPAASSYDTRRQLQVAIQQKFLNNRITINAGGNLDFGNNTTAVENGNNAKSVIPTGDFQIEYALTKDGRWKAKAFNRTNYDYYNSRNYNRTGIGITYSKEFDKPSELAPKKRKPKKQKENEQPVVPAPPANNTTTPVQEGEKDQPKN